MASTFSFDHPHAPSGKGPGILYPLVESILAWLVRCSDDSTRARQARNFGRLNALSDAELAKLGLRRSDLFHHCFGAAAYT